MSRRSSVQCNLPCPPRYGISTKQAMCKQNSYTIKLNPEKTGLYNYMMYGCIHMPMYTTVYEQL